MTLRGHEQFEVLISASFSDDITEDEREQLDAHLDGCVHCRETLGAFADQRRVMAGLRHVAPPRDLHARVRTGIETGGHGGLPWWRRPTVIFGGLGAGLATVAGALLALVVLNGGPDDGNVGFGSATPEPSGTFALASFSATPAPTPIVSDTPVPAPTSSATQAPQPTPTPPVLAAEPDVFLAYGGPTDNPLMTLRDGATGETVAEVPAPASGPAVAAQMSPNGQWLAYITQVGLSGMHDVWALRLDPSDMQPPISLGRGVAGSEFLEHLSWSGNSRYLAYTLADTEGGGTDAWIFEPGFGEPRRLTDVGNAYAGSWVPGAEGTPLLWVSTAGDPPMSYLHEFDGSDPGSGDRLLGGSGDPGAGAVAEAPGVFQPLVSPAGQAVIYWRGVMEQSGDEWHFSQAGSPYIATTTDDSIGFVDERPLFADVPIDRDAFVDAGIAWGADGDAYAVWAAEWSGLPQGEGGEYPSIRRVYFGHASDARNLLEGHAIDIEDIPQDASVIDVKVTTTRHLLITAAEPAPGDLAPPRARLIVVARNTGDVPDEVADAPDTDQELWYGPAAFDREAESSAP